jgi:N-methylhydantoinase A
MSDDAPALAVDVGGTFTDAALLAGGRLETAKTPTTGDQSEGVLAATRAACGAAGVSPGEVGRFRHATTVGTNALLENAGGNAALVTTAGFGDVIAIGRQTRPSLYDPRVRRPEPPVPRERRFELDERATPEGVENAVDGAEVRAVAARIREREPPVEAVAVCLLHAYAHPDNERRAAAILREELDVPVSASHEVLPTFREYERTATTVADAMLAPVVGGYLERLIGRASEAGLPAPRVMQSNGGIADAATVRERRVTTALSGPAAGVVGAGAVAGDCVTVDMGGTSTDVGLVRDGTTERTTGADVGDLPVRVPMVDVRTVGAGGGSIARVDAGGALRVGPESAGADPGPACYGRGGTDPTVTDAAAVLGYLGTDLGDLTLERERAERALADLAAAADLPGARTAARGVVRVAVATTARAVRSVTVERGYDPRSFALCAFGGAGPMLAATLADGLDVGEVLVPRGAGVLSALGLLAADERHDAVRTYRRSLADADPDAVEDVYGELTRRAVADAAGEPTVARSADCRYAGQRHEVRVDVPVPFDPASVRERFHAAHERERGYRMDEPVDLVTLGATATVAGGLPELAFEPSGDPERGRRRVAFGTGNGDERGSGRESERERERETPVYDRRGLAPGALDGPAVVESPASTTVVPPGWTATVTPAGHLRLTRGGSDG